jgi:hypothetical protein
MTAQLLNKKTDAQAKFRPAKPEFPISVFSQSTVLLPSLQLPPMS